MQPSTINASTAERAYLAGLFDGEGCVGIYPAKINGYPNYTMYVSIGMADPQGVLLAGALYGGSLITRRHRGGWRAIHYWKCSTVEAERFVRDVLPYLRVKREQAEIFLQFRATISPNKARVTGEILDLRRTLMERCKALKRA